MAEVLRAPLDFANMRRRARLGKQHQPRDAHSDVKNRPPSNPPANTFPVARAVCHYLPLLDPVLKLILLLCAISLFIPPHTHPPTHNVKVSRLRPHPPRSMARVYADVNANMPRSYWDYDSVNIAWGVLENYEVVRKIGTYPPTHLRTTRAQATKVGRILT